jgi:hypothetical protein
MLRLVLVVVLAGCIREDTSRIPGDANEALPEGASCFIDSDCAAGSVCLRTAGCWSQDKLYTAHVTWTINGMPPSATACATLAALTLEFDGTRGVFTAFRPVACAEGKFTLGSVPPTVKMVKLGSRELGWKTAMIDTSTGAAMIDLTF